MTSTIPVTPFLLNHRNLFAVIPHKSQLILQNLIVIPNAKIHFYHLHIAVIINSVMIAQSNT